MSVTLHFISGLPMSGASLLGNLLMQNPRLRATPNSGLVDLVYLMRERWNRLPAFRASPNEAAKLRTFRAMLAGFHDDDADSRPVVLDRSDAWPALIETVEAALGRKAKILAPVRDMRDTLAALELLWRRNAATWEIPQERADLFKWQTLEGRCEVWMKRDQPLGQAYSRLRDAVFRGLRDRLLFVEYERLTREPAQVMEEIYAFLGETPYAHDFTNIPRRVIEDDSKYGLPGLESAPDAIAPEAPLWNDCLGLLGQKYAPLNRLWQGRKD